MNQLSKIFVHETRRAIYVWVMPVSEFVEGALSNHPHRNSRYSENYEFNESCNCYKCMGKGLCLSMLEWALMVDESLMFSSIDESKEYLKDNYFAIEALNRADRCEGNYRLDKEIFKQKEISL